MAFWTFVAAAVITMTAIGVGMKSGRTDVQERIIWDIGWIGWAPLTLVVLGFCRRYPVDRQRRISTIARLSVVGLGIVALQILFDFGCITLLGMALRGTPVTYKFLLYISVYKAHIYYGVYWMIVGAAHALEFHRRFRESELTSSQLEAKLATAELDRLKAQLQPHFLFNTHNTIVSLMLKNENKAAIRMLSRLSDLLRISLSRSGRKVVTVREEMETLDMYLEIQRERFRDRLTIHISVPPEVAEAEIPHLILQPLVENALIHGLEDVSENAVLTIDLAREGSALICRVGDNGVGFTVPTDHDGSVKEAGIGLSITRDRLRQLYGSSQALLVTSAAGHGCVATLHLPFRLYSDVSLVIAQ